MAPAGRRTNPSLKQLLFEEGYEFDFFQAVRLLTRMHPHLAPLGGKVPSNEAVKLVAHLTFAFPAAAIHDIKEIPGGRHRVLLAFFGLTGTQGVLPCHYTEHLIARRAAKDNAMTEFFDLFNHRLASLFYRAWERHRPYVLYERAPRTGTLDPFTHYLFDLIGMGTPGLRGRLPFNDQALLAYAGLIGQRPRSVSALRGILRDYFRVPVEIEQCIGDWYPLSEQDRSYMIREGLHNQLGEGAICGDEVWDQQARFRIRLGPLGLERYLAFLPSGDALPALVAWTRYFAGPTFAFEVNLILKAGEVPPCHPDDERADAPRLGWLGWLETERFSADPADVEFTYVS